MLQLFMFVVIAQGCFFYYAIDKHECRIFSKVALMLINSLFICSVAVIYELVVFNG